MLDIHEIFTTNKNLHKKLVSQFTILQIVIVNTNFHKIVLKQHGEIAREFAFLQTIER
jgi:hypothetical protein